MREHLEKYKVDAIKSNDRDEIIEVLLHMSPQFWPELEPIAIKDSYLAYLYANIVLRSRWPAAESILKRNPHIAYLYAKQLINGRWYEAEPYIMEDAEIACHYAVEVIKGRWPEAETVIFSKPFSAVGYARDILKGPDERVKEVAALLPGAAVFYATEVMEARWYEIEPSLIGIDDLVLDIYLKRLGLTLKTMTESNSLFKTIKEFSEISLNI